MGRKGKFLGYCIFSFSLLLSLAFPRQGFSITMALRPESQSVSQGQIFTLDLRIENHATAGDILAAQFSLSFNPSLLSVTNASGQEVTSLSSNSSFPDVLQNSVSNSMGIVNYTAGNLANGQTATVTVVSITFTAKAGGIASLILSNTSVLLFSDFSEHIPDSIVNASITISGTPPGDITAPSSSVSTLPAFQKVTTFTARWTGVDNSGGSGLKLFHIQSRVGAAGSWADFYIGSDTSKSFTGVSGTTYYFRSRAQDNAGNWEDFPSSQNGDTSTTLDTQSPQVDVSVPEEGTFVTVTVAVSPIVFDNVGISKVQFFIDNVFKGEDPSDPYVFSWNTTLETGGSHTVLVKAVDKAGNSTQDSHTVTVDNAFPQSQVTALPAYVNTENFTVSWSGTDDTQIVSFDIEYKAGTGGAWTSLLADTVLTGTAFTGTAGTTYFFRSRAKDQAGNIESFPSSESGDTSVTIDLTAPSASITTPAAGSYLMGSVAVSVSASDNVGISKVEFYVDNALQGTDTASPYSFTWNTTAFTDGPRTLKALAYDTDNKTGTSTITVTSDNTAPASSVSALPAITGTASFIVSWSGTDNTGLGTFDVQSREGTTGAWTDFVTNTSGTSAAFTGADGKTYYFRSRAKDKAGNQESYPADTSPDAFTQVVVGAPTVAISSPADKAVLRGITTVSVSASVSGGTITKVEYFIDGSLAETDTGTPFEYKWNTNVFTDGAHTFKAQATSSFAKVNSATISATTDNTPPTCTVSSLSATQSKTTFAVNWSGADSTSGVKTFDVEFKEKDENNTLVSDFKSWKAATTATTDSFTGINGHSYTFRCRALDAAGNQGNFSSEVNTKVSVAFTLDVFPRAGSKVEIQVTANSAPAVKVTQFGLSEAVVQNPGISGNVYTFSYTLQTGGDGIAAFTVDVSGIQQQGSFMVGTITSKATTFSDLDGLLFISFSENSKTSSVPIAIYTNNISTPAKLQTPSSELVPVGGVVRVSPETLSVPAIVTLAYSDSQVTGANVKESQVGAFTIDSQNKKTYVEGQFVDTTFNQVSFQTTTLSDTGLFADILAPSISSFSVEEGQVVVEKKPALTAKVADATSEGSGVNVSALVATLDGKQEAVEFSGDTLTVKLSQKLSDGGHTLKITAVDKVGNSTEVTRNFSVKTELIVDKVYNFPNPATTSTTFSVTTNKLCSEVFNLQVDIYTLSGKKILSLLDIMPGDCKISYTIPTEIANGVYLYRITGTDGTTTVTTSGKLAVLR